jgi:hypothetical protein
VEKLMPKRKANIEVGKRAFEELDRIFNLSKYGGAIKASKSIGCRRNTLYEWEKGVTPETIYLIRLHYLGADVIYIMTGVRNKNGKLKTID